MAILVDAHTRVLCQGMTGWAGSHHSAQMIEYGTRIVAGVTPGKGGRVHIGVPVFDTVRAAVEQTKANASIVFVPPDYAAGAILEAIDAELPLVVAVTERIPGISWDRSVIAAAPLRSNCWGRPLWTLCKIGVMATGSERPGSIGIMSRSASLTSEIVAQITSVGLGQSTTVGVGGDPIHGIGFIECMEMFFADKDTTGIVLIGEIGGAEEERAAEFLAGIKPQIPIIALIVGRHAPPERRMGHAGALTKYKGADAASKIAALQAVGVIIAQSAHRVGETVREALAPPA